jgi:hypothetical protein
MKKLNAIYFVAMIIGVSFLCGCQDDDAAPSTPTTEFKMKVDGQDFTYKVLKGRYFITDKSADIESHELDSTFNNQRVIGLQVDYSKVTTPGDYDFEKGGVFDVIMYMFNTTGNSYQAKKGIITFKKITETRLEATFTSITLQSGSQGVQPVTLTDGSIYIDLVKQDD